MQVALLGGGLVAEPLCDAIEFNLRRSSSTIFATFETACAAPSLLPLATADATSAAAEAAFMAGVECFDLEICWAVAPATAAATALAAMRLICSATFSSSVILSDAVFEGLRSASTLVFGLLGTTSVSTSTEQEESRFALFT